HQWGEAVPCPRVRRRHRPAVLGEDVANGPRSLAAVSTAVGADQAVRGCAAVDAPLAFIAPGPVGAPVRPCVVRTWRVTLRFGPAGFNPPAKTISPPLRGSSPTDSFCAAGPPLRCGS